MKHTATCHNCGHFSMDCVDYGLNDGLGYYVCEDCDKKIEQALPTECKSCDGSLNDYGQCEQCSLEKVWAEKEKTNNV